MTIDGRGRLGQKLEVEVPVELDLQQLDPAAGELIAKRMDAKGVDRAEAIVGIVNYAARLMAEGVVSLNTSRIFDKHPEVQQAVNEAGRTPRELTVAQALTVLIVKGAKPPKKDAKPGDLGLGDLLGRTRDQGRDSLADLLDGILRKDDRRK